MANISSIWRQFIIFYLIIKYRLPIIIAITVDDTDELLSYKFALEPHACKDNVSHSTLHSFTCLNVVVDRRFSGRFDTNDRITCIFRHFSNVPRKLRSFEDIVSRNIIRNRLPNLLYCEDFLIITTNLTEAMHALLTPNGKVKRFRPFSRIMFVFDSTSSGSHEIERNERDYLKQSGIYGYLLDFGIDGFRGVINMWNSNYRPFSAIPYEWFTNDHHAHPLVSQRRADEEFRIGLYNCSPYIMYDTEGRR